MQLLIAALLATSHFDKAFCPLAPASAGYQDTANYFSLGPSGKFDGESSFQVASRLVDVHSGKLVGWLFLDEHGGISVSLVPHVDPKIYAAFDMVANNKHRPQYATEAILQRRFRLPKGIEIWSCTQPNS